MRFPSFAGMDFSAALPNEVAMLAALMADVMEKSEPEAYAEYLVQKNPSGDNEMAVLINLGLSKNAKADTKAYLEEPAKKEESAQAKALAAFYNIVHIKTMVMKAIAGKKAVTNLLTYFKNMATILKPKVIHQAEVALIQGIKTGVLAAVANVGEGAGVTVSQVRNNANSVVEKIEKLRAPALAALAAPQKFVDISNPVDAVSVAIEGVGLVGTLKRVINETIQSLQTAGRDAISTILVNVP